LYFQRVYTGNVTYSVQRIAYLITFPTITVIFITFLAVCNSQSLRKIAGPLRILLSGSNYLRGTHKNTPQSV